jgi:hypothetical protein
MYNGGPSCLDCLFGNLPFCFYIRSYRLKGKISEPIILITIGYERIMTLEEDHTQPSMSRVRLCISMLAITVSISFIREHTVDIPP